MDEITAMFLGAFAGTFFGAIAQSLFLAAMGPMKNRREHKRLMDKQTFREQWGRNSVSFFLLHGGFGRGME